jgi:cell division protein FtsW (lipid II flippase)
MSPGVHGVILQRFKHLVSGVDAAPMATLGGQVWVILAVTAGVGVLGILHYVAASFHNATYVHDMRVRIAALRKNQAERLQALAEATQAAEQASIQMAQSLKKAA